MSIKWKQSFLAQKLENSPKLIDSSWHKKSPIWILKDFHRLRMQLIRETDFFITSNLKLSFILAIHVKIEKNGFMECQKIYLQVWFTICEASKATMTVPKFKTASLSKSSSVLPSNSINSKDTTVQPFPPLGITKKRSGQKPTFSNLTEWYWKKEPMKKMERTNNVFNSFNSHKNCFQKF